MGGVTIVWHTGIFSTQRADAPQLNKHIINSTNERKQIYCNLVDNLSWCPNVPKTGTYLQVAWDIGLELMAPNMARHGNRCPTLTLILQEAYNIVCVDINKFTLISLTCRTWWWNLEGIWTCPRTARWGTPSPEHMWTKTNKDKNRKKCEQNKTHAHHFVLCHLGGAAMVSVCWARLDWEEDQRYLQIISSWSLYLSLALCVVFLIPTAVYYIKSR